MCSICLDDLAEGQVHTLEPCKHTFHVYCIVASLRVSPACPLCGDNPAAAQPPENLILPPVAAQAFAGLFPPPPQAPLPDAGQIFAGFFPPPPMLMLADGPACKACSSWILGVSVTEEVDPSVIPVQGPQQKSYVKLRAFIFVVSSIFAT